MKASATFCGTVYVRILNLKKDWQLNKLTSVFYASVLLLIINIFITFSKYLWIDEAIANTSAYTTIFISPWKWPWHRYSKSVGTSKRIKILSFSCACACAYALLQRVKTKYRSGITQAQGYLCFANENTGSRLPRA